MPNSNHSVKIRQKIYLNQSIGRRDKNIVCVSEYIIGNKKEYSVLNVLNPKQKASKQNNNESIITINDSNDLNLLNSDKFKQMLIKFLSLMYGIFLIITSAIVTIAGIDNPDNQNEYIYDMVVTIIGIAWITFFHWDIQKYKKLIIRDVKPGARGQHKAKRVQCGQIEEKEICVISEFESHSDKEVKPANDVEHDSYPQYAYLFCVGKNSGNFYLKCGMILFCMGTIIHQGVRIAKQIHFFSANNSRCFNAIRLLHYLMRCISGFYQLYIVFKYSNILINRFKTVAIFALMHLVGSSVSFWFSTIIEETIEDYVLRVELMNGTYNYSVIDDEALFRKTVSQNMYCSKTALVNTDSMEALPYLYPFSIEYNIMLASVWYIMWTNIGKTDIKAYTHHIKQEFTRNKIGFNDISYKSVIAINADCHASNFGLFVGLLTLLIIFSTMVIFFATMRQKEYAEIAVSIYSAQSGLLLALSVITIPFAYRKIRQLDITNKEHFDSGLSSMDDFLVLIPLPFFIIFYLLSINAEIQVMSINSILLAIIRFISLIHIAIQTPFIVDATRRCANTKRLRFTKPGRGLVMILILLNITLWILYTFERKSVDKYHNMQNYYGKFIWMVITHTTIPLILFYYFHCSVCLSEIWKHGYEKDESLV